MGDRLGTNETLFDSLRTLSIPVKAIAKSSGGSDHGSLIGLEDDDHAQYVHTDTARTITAVHTFNPAAVGAPLAIGANGAGQFISGLNADQVDGYHASAFVLGTRQVIAGNGLTGGGALSADVTLHVGAGAGLTVNADDVSLTTPGTLTIASTNSAAGNHTHAITSSSNPGAAASLLASDAAGALQLTGLTISGNLNTSRVASHLIPVTTDTYDLGSSTLLWRQGYLSQLNAVIFAEQTVQLLGGWLMIPKDAGTLPAVSSAQTQIDFGKSMTVGHFILVRAHDTGGAVKAEYMQVGSLVGGTTYNVTRDVAGAHGTDPAWADGIPYALLGTTGDGRIELNAYDSPRIALISQGATYNAQTELVRIGDLNGNWGYSAQVFGIGLGEYTIGRSSLAIDSTNGIRIFNGTTVIGQWSAAGVITIGQASASQNNIQISSGAIAIRNNTTERIALTAAGVLTIKDSSGGAVFTFDSGAGAEFTKPLSLGVNGGIYQGSGTFSGPTTGLKIWNDSGIGRIAGYNSETVQWYANTDGKFYAGGGSVSIDSNGINIISPWELISDGRWDALRFYYGSTLKLSIGVRRWGAMNQYFTTSIFGDSAGDDLWIGTPHLYSGSAYRPTIKVSWTTAGGGGDVEIHRHLTAYGGLNVGSATGAGVGDLKMSGSIRQSTGIGARVYNTTTQVAVNGSWTALQFNSERWDTDNIHSTSTNTNRLTCNTAGFYVISGSIAHAPNVGALGIFHSTAGAIAVLDTQPSVRATITTIWYFNVGEYVEMRVYNNSGSNQTIPVYNGYSQEFSMVRIA
jgi:hypothetical protein